MQNNNIDQTIVQALNFSNLVHLDKCFHLIHLITLPSKNQSIQKKHKSSTKSKFQKVPYSSVKSKTISAQSSSNQFKNVYIDNDSKLLNLQNFLVSKVKTNSNQFDPFQTPTLQNYQQSSISLASQNSYTVNDFLKQTAISLSRNNQSPINDWKSNSVQKSDKNPFQQINFKHKPQVKLSINNMNQNSFQKVSNYPQVITNQSNEKDKSSKKIKSKFEKSKSTVKVSNEKKINNYGFIQQVNTSEQTSKKNSIKLQQFDVQTRDTCELEPSKLQKLMQVEDNKYKQIILKTFYKHQK